MDVLTFVTPQPQPDFDLWIKKSYPNIMIENRVVLDDRAVQWYISQPLDKIIIDSIRREFRVDVFYTDRTPIKLFMADMDSTIVHGETLDDMAALVGIGDKIAAITARAMAGELDFEQALLHRISMLKGFSTEIIDKTLHETQINSGAEELLNHLKKKNVFCVLISGGFIQFTSKIAEKLQFNAHFGNELVIHDQTISGDVKRPILDKHFKLQKLHELQNQMGLNPREIVAIGDGANDLPMLNAAGIGVAYHGKPILKDTLINQINYTDLSSLIYII
jgi:phosphoserine phosphatase